MEVKIKEPVTVIPRQPRPEQRVDTLISGPGKYEVTKDQVFTVTISLKEYKGRWVISDKMGKGIEDHSIVFRIWTYQEMVELRKKATTFDPQKRTSVIDYDFFNRLKIQKLLQSWTFEKDNPRLKIHRVNDIMTDESWRAFCSLPPYILEKIISEMNLVLDYGG